MQHTWILELKEDHEELDDKQLITRVFQKEKKDMGIFLSYYFRKQGAVAEEPEIFNDIQASAAGIGWFEVGFRLVFFNACLNIHEQEKDKMQIRFKIDRNSGVVELTGPYWPEREMDEI
jgi:hypothetical protein